MPQEIKKTDIRDLFQSFKHPSTALFRAIELRQIYEGCNSLKLTGTSIDLGCGDGKISSLLFKEKLTYGIDNGEAGDYKIAIKKKRYSQVILESAEKMSLPDKSIEYIFSNSVLEHIPQIKLVFNEVSRLLKKNGYFIFTTPSKHFRRYIKISEIFNKIGLGIINRQYSKYRNKSLNHYNLYDHIYYEKELKKYGLTVIKHSYSISEKVLTVWDRTAVKIKIYKLFGKDIEKIETYRNLELFETLYKEDRLSKKRGANLLIIAKKD